MVYFTFPTRRRTTRLVIDLKYILDKIQQLFFSDPSTDIITRLDMVE